MHEAKPDIVLSMASERRTSPRSTRALVLIDGGQNVLELSCRILHDVNDRYKLELGKEPQLIGDQI